MEIKELNEKINNLNKELWGLHEELAKKTSELLMPILDVIPWKFNRPRRLEFYDRNQEVFGKIYEVWPHDYHDEIQLFEGVYLHSNDGDLSIDFISQEICENFLKERPLLLDSYEKFLKERQSLAEGNRQAAIKEIADVQKQLGEIKRIKSGKEK